MKSISDIMHSMATKISFWTGTSEVDFNSPVIFSEDYDESFPSGSFWSLDSTYRYINTREKRNSYKNTCEYCGRKGTIDGDHCSRCGGPVDGKD